MPFFWRACLLLRIHRQWETSSSFLAASMVVKAGLAFYQ